MPITGCCQPVAQTVGVPVPAEPHSGKDLLTEHAGALPMVLAERFSDLTGALRLTLPTLVQSGPSQQSDLPRGQRLRLPLPLLHRHFFPYILNGPCASCGTCLTCVYAVCTCVCACVSSLLQCVFLSCKLVPIQLAYHRTMPVKCRIHEPAFGFPTC